MNVWLSKKAAKKFQNNEVPKPVKQWMECLETSSAMSAEKLLQSGKTHKLKLDGGETVFYFRVNPQWRILFSVEGTTQTLIIYDIIDRRKL